MRIVSATGLSKADWIGTSEPYAVVIVNCRKIGRTRTLFKTQNPVWSDPEEIFPLRVPGTAIDYNVVVRLWDEDFGKSANLAVMGCHTQMWTQSDRQGSLTCPTDWRGLCAS